MSVPTKDSLLVGWSANLIVQLTADPATYFATLPQISIYTDLNTPYVAAVNALNAAREEGTRSASLTQARDTAKAPLLAAARQWYRLIQGNNDITNEAKTLAGVHIPATSQTPIPAPAVAPGIDDRGVVGRTWTVGIHDSDSVAKVGKPAGAVCAYVYSFVGEEYPADPSLWEFRGGTTKAQFQIEFPAGLPGGTKVFMTAAWVNAKSQAGPTAAPISTTLQGGGVAAAQGELKIAA